MYDKELEAQLNERKIKATAMRLLVLDFLLRQPAAVSLNDLEAHFLRSDRITLYRTLKTFEEKGLVHSIGDGTGAVKYALCAESCRPQEHHDLHVHFHCSQCGETYCLPKSRIPEIPLPEGFDAREASLVMKGTCANCAANNAMRLQAGRQ